MRRLHCDGYTGKSCLREKKVFLSLCLLQSGLHKSVNACLAPLASIDGCSVTTADGIGSVRNNTLDEVQEVISASFGSQCGFCTPGIVMAVFAYRQAHPTATPEQIVKSLDGNLCRCTGYRPIIEAVRQLTSAPAPLALSPLPPPALKALEASNDEATWWRPTTLSQLLEIKQQHPAARVVVGNTEVGVEAKFKGARYAHLISPALVPEMHAFAQSEEGVELGAALPLSMVQLVFEGLDKSLPSWQVGR
jgi:xanthine dehydrogenase/oxidase